MATAPIELQQQVAKWLYVVVRPIDDEGPVKIFCKELIKLTPVERALFKMEISGPLINLVESMMEMVQLGLREYFTEFLDHLEEFPPKEPFTFTFATLLDDSKGWDMIHGGFGEPGIILVLNHNDV